MESLVAIHNHTHSNLDWLLRDVLPTLDYTIAIRQARQCPEEHLPAAEETDGQKFSQALLQLIRKWITWRPMFRGQ